MRPAGNNYQNRDGLTNKNNEYDPEDCGIY